MISTTFDVEKGAGAAASSIRLRDCMLSAGIDVHTLSLEDFSNGREVNVDQPVAGTKIGFWINCNDGVHWQALREKVQRIDADCIVLGAVDRGILSMFDIARLRYPIVWVVRDNWVHTGGCLFKLPPSEVELLPAEYESYFPSLTCELYKSGCVQCPALNDIRESSKTRISWEFKRVVLDYRRDIVFAPISGWMADMLKAAPLTEKHAVIPVTNPINLSVVRRLQQRPTTIRKELGLSEDEKIVLLAAHSFTNPRKGLKNVMNALAGDERFKNVVFVGMGKALPAEKLVPTGIRFHSLGYVSTEEEKVLIYNEVDATLVTSLQESLSVVASDSICCGTPVVAFKTSGLTSFLTHRETGYLASSFDPSDLLNGLVWVLQDADRDYLSSVCVAKAREIFESSQNVAALLSVVDRAIENYGALGEVPAEIEAIASAMELVNDDHLFRFTHARGLRKKINKPSIYSGDDFRETILTRWGIAPIATPEN